MRSIVARHRSGVNVVEVREWGMEWHKLKIVSKPFVRGLAIDAGIIHDQDPFKPNL